MEKIIKYGDFHKIDPTAEFERIYKISRDEKNNPILYIFDNGFLEKYDGLNFSDSSEECKKTDFDKYNGLIIKNLQDVLNYTIFATADREKMLAFADHIIDYETVFQAPTFEHLERLQAAINKKSTPKIEKLKIKIFDRMEKNYNRDNVKYTECKFFLNQLFNL